MVGKVVVDYLICVVYHIFDKVTPLPSTALTTALALTRLVL